MGPVRGHPENFSLGLKIMRSDGGIFWEQANKKALSGKLGNEGTVEFCVLGKCRENKIFVHQLQNIGEF